MHFLKSWLHDVRRIHLYRVGYRCILIFQISNRTIGCILLKWSARLYGDCMAPDQMAKYSLPMLTALI
jgi:hypothetical protein